MGVEVRPERLRPSVRSPRSAAWYCRVFWSRRNRRILPGKDLSMLRAGLAGQLGQPAADVAEGLVGRDGELGLISAFAARASCYDEEARAAEASRRRVLALAADTAALVLPAHLWARDRRPVNGAGVLPGRHTRGRAGRSLPRRQGAAHDSDPQLPADGNI